MLRVGARVLSEAAAVACAPATGVKAGRERHSLRHGDAAVCRSESKEALVGGGHTHGAGCVAADGQVGLAPGHD